MSVIRALSATECNEQREKEKAKLEKDYKRSDKCLEELIAENHTDLTTTMQIFSNVSMKLIASRDKIARIRENLETSKNLLNCKRDELKKLWLQGIEHKHVLYLLEQIESLKDVAEHVQNHISKKHYLHATQLLVSSIKQLENDLDGVEGLNEVRTELQKKKTHLHEVVIEELHKHLYVKSTCEVYHQMQRQGTSYGREMSPFHRSGSDRSKKDMTTTPQPNQERKENGLTVKRNFLDITPITPTHMQRQRSRTGVLSPNGNDSDSEVVYEDLSILNPEEDTEHFMAILVECLVLLNSISDAVEVIKNRMQRELRAIVHQASQQVIENIQTFQGEDLATQKQPRVLLELLQLLFEQFRCVAHAHKCVLANFKRAVSVNQLEVTLYESADVWSKMQVVLEALLSDYLDVQNTTSTQQRTSAFNETITDITSFFSRKNVKSKRVPLFRFDSSSLALSVNSYLNEQKQALYGTSADDDSGMEKNKYYVCCPDAKNITMIFKPLMKFSEEIEQILDLCEGAHCTLYTFVTDYVKDVFLVQVQVEIANNTEAATKNLDAWKAYIDPEMQKNLNISRPLLQNTVSVYSSIQELRDLMCHLPFYSEHFLNLICSILVNYKETCQAAYRGIVQPESEDKRIISATWAKDEDISRFLRSLPNWTNLQNWKENKGGDYEESPEEIKARNRKESDMLTENLGDILIPHHEILGDVQQLRVLALLQESLEWFGGRIVRFAEILPNPMNSPTTPVTPSTPMGNLEDMAPVADNTIQSLRQLGHEFEELANTCLLVMHLEVRVHCFYYLLPVAKQGSFASGMNCHDPDPDIMKLNKDLASIEEAMTATLQPKKFKYVFEGLGHLISSILISSVQYIKRINANGIKKMCRNIFAIQQNLTNITMSREVALDHARHYYELLYHNIEEILNLIVDQGPQFTEMEYINALSLLHRAQPENDPAELTVHLERLKEILNEVAVTL